MEHPPAIGTELGAEITSGDGDFAQLVGAAKVAFQERAPRRTVGISLLHAMAFLHIGWVGGVRSQEPVIG